MAAATGSVSAVTTDPAQTDLRTGIAMKPRHHAMRCVVGGR
jgi:hypothetical protein